LHTTGGGNVVPGLPFAFTHLRGPHRNQQVILAITTRHRLATADPPLPQAS
jgi:hypothetical protein